MPEDGDTCLVIVSLIVVSQRERRVKVAQSTRAHARSDSSHSAAGRLVSNMALPRITPVSLFGPNFNMLSLENRIKSFAD